MLYPLKFIPVYKNIIWGGNNIAKKFNRQLPDGNIAESWELCCREDGMSVVSNGSLKGKSLDEILESYGQKILGKDIYEQYEKMFPLLIKIIDANDKLSVQVHPDDRYAAENEGCKGKTEMWYIIDAKPGANLIYGLKEGTTKIDFLKSITENNIQDILNEVPVAPGDAFYIPAGTVHAIQDGILIAEIQQNSNITYRVYDWGRVDSSGNPRQLHIDKALDVIDFSRRPYTASPLDALEAGTYTIRSLSKSEFFSVDEISIKGKYYDTADGSKFHIYMVIDGEGSIEFSEGQEDIKPGETILIPASLGEYNITGNIKLLKAYM